MVDYNEMQKIGLSYMDIKTLEHVEQVMEGNRSVSALLIKAYNSGFKKGAKEYYKEFDEQLKNSFAPREWY